MASHKFGDENDPNVINRANIASNVGAGLNLDYMKAKMAPSDKENRPKSAPPVSRFVSMNTVSMNSNKKLIILC